jgi:hypothetical protein
MSRLPHSLDNRLTDGSEVCSTDKTTKYFRMAGGSDFIVRYCDKHPEITARDHKIRKTLCRHGEGKRLESRLQVITCRLLRFTVSTSVEKEFST